MSTHDLDTTIQLPLEEDVDVYIEFEVTSWGTPGSGPSFYHPGDPPEPVEFHITKVIRDDNEADITAEVQALPDEWLRKVEELVFLEVCEINDDRAYGLED